MSKVLVLKSSILAGYSQSNQLSDYLLNNGAKSTPLMKSPFATWLQIRFRYWMANWLVHCVRAMRR